MMNAVSATLNFEVGQIGNQKIIDDKRSIDIEKKANENIALSKTDWDSFEISWEFKFNPLV